MALAEDSGNPLEVETRQLQLGRVWAVAARKALDQLDEGLGIFQKVAVGVQQRAHLAVDHSAELEKLQKDTRSTNRKIHAKSASG